MKELQTKLKSHIPSLIKEWHNEEKQKSSSEILNKVELKTISQALLSLQRGLTGDRQLAGAGYMQKPALLGAYLLYYWPVTYMQLSYILADNKALYTAIAKKAVEEQRPLHILDIGSGPGPATCAICDMLQPLCPSITVTLLDSSPKALALAKRLLRHSIKNDNAIKTIATTLAKSNAAKDADPLQESVPEKGYDIICMSHVINELWKNEDDATRLQNSTNYCRQIFSYMNSSGICIINEPALLATSRFLLSLRNALCNDGFQVCAPCLDNSPCPALSAGASHTCHADIPWKAPYPIADLAIGAGLDRTSVKMTYCIFSKEPSCPTQNQNDESITGRVVSEGMLNKSGRIRFLLCTGTKRIPLSAKKADPIALKQHFFTLQRHDLICLQNPELRNAGQADSTAYGIGQKTTIQLISRMGVY
ncbi:MAG: small ribosomal subunit Rsm22 family protein [Treponema sp.]|nr:small ribosomal subunit Rsm22 family protein [Treponema sp.]